MGHFILIALCSILTWLAGVVFYHAAQRNSDVFRTELTKRRFKRGAWLLILFAFAVSIEHLGWEVGLFLALFVGSLVLLISLFVASRWPKIHLWSAPFVAFICIALNGVWIGTQL